MPYPIYTVDAFADRPFAGNPAAVCLLAAPRDAAWMQRVAAEMMPICAHSTSGMPTWPRTEGNCSRPAWLR